MTALEKLLSQMGRKEQAAARLAYVLGYHHSEQGATEQVSPGSPEHEKLTGMRMIEPDLW